MDWTNPLIYIAMAGFLYGVVRGLLAIGVWKGRTDESVTTIKDAISEIRQDISQLFAKLSSDTISRRSRPRLTDLGKKISESLKAADWAKKEVETMHGNFKEMSPYNLQQLAFDTARAEKYAPEGFESQMLEDMKSVSFFQGLPLSDIENVLAIELRDVLLAIYHPELSGMPDDPPTQ